MKVVFFCCFFCGNPVLVSCTKTEVCYEDNIDYYGEDLANISYDQVPSERDCQERCKANPDCKFWTWGKPGHSHGPKICYQKGTIQERKINNKTISGPKFCTSKYTLYWFYSNYLIKGFINYKLLFSYFKEYIVSSCIENCDNNLRCNVLEGHLIETFLAQK